jgi:hypothetical protein
MSVQSEIYAGGEELLVALAEQLKLPLLHISQHLEIVRAGGELQPQHIEHVADMAMYLIDSYILSRQLTLSQTQLELEPVSVSSVLQSAAHRLDGIAKEYACDVSIELSGRYGPVMAHRQGLEASIVSLGYSFIEAQQVTGKQKSRVVLAAHKTRFGITAGIYGDHEELTADMFRRARLLFGRAKHSLPPLGHSANAGIFVADLLMSLMQSKLYVSRHSKLTGLAAVLVPNPQLALV